MMRLTNLSAGAPSLLGVNGSLCNVFDWALPQAGWAIEYTATNARVYRPPAGNRARLQVRHDSAVSGSAGLATVRGAEGATSATALVDPFPLVSQLADNSSTVMVGVNTVTPKEYEILITDRFVLFAVGALMSNSSGWDFMFFGDLAPAYSEDAYATAIHVGASTAPTASTGRAMASSMSGGIVPAKTYWMRSVDGSIKSTIGCLWGSGTATTSNFCTVTGAPTMRSGYKNQIVREKLGATCTGGVSSAGALAVSRRAMVPFLWNPVHTNIGSITSDDTFTDSAYAVGATFRVCPASAAIACILELTDTWSP